MPLRRVAIIVGYGAASWAIALAVAMCISPLRESDRPLFETIMPVTVAACAVLLGLRVRGRRPLRGLAQGLTVGLAWMAVNIALDLPLFSWGPLAMPPTAYFKDIGLTYVIYPLVLAGLAIPARSPG
jgi:hypothetical protein